MTQIIDHGKWVSYVPEKWPEHAPPNALFARRESDGVDWYEYVRAGTNFSTDTVKFTVWWQDAYNGYVVGAATRDLNQFPMPAGMLVREIIDYHGGEPPQVELGQKLYDPDTHRLRPLPPLPPVFDVRDLEARLAALEARLESMT